MLSLEAAYSAVLAHVNPLEKEDVLLSEAAGRILAEPVHAVRDIPPCSRSSVDGYAVRVQDLDSPPATLRLAGEIPAGAPPEALVKPGTCVRIFTGACIPEGASAVEMLEHTKRGSGAEIRFERRLKPGAHILMRGEDRMAGAVLLAAGTRLGPVPVGILAANGSVHVEVFRRPAVSVLVTGQELCSSSAPLPYQIHDANGPMIEALLGVHGFPVRHRARIPDDLGAIAEQIRECRRHSDVIVLSGGVSVGAYDFVPEAITGASGQIVFHGVSLKPGKPQLFAEFGANRFAFGLPGNPLSALTGVVEFVLPALRRLSGMQPGACRPELRLPLLSPLSLSGSRQRVLLGRLVSGPDGASVETLPSNSSGDLPSAALVDGLVLTEPGAREVPAGTRVRFRPLWSLS